MQYRKRGTVEAEQITEAYFAKMSTGETVTLESGGKMEINPETKTVTLPGNRVGNIGDWLIHGPKPYLMHDEEFKKLYEPMEGVIHPPIQTGMGVVA